MYVKTLLLIFYWKNLKNICNAHISGIVKYEGRKLDGNNSQKIWVTFYWRRKIFFKFYHSKLIKKKNKSTKTQKKNENHSINCHY